jgi:hypothetical protein
VKRGQRRLNYRPITPEKRREIIKMAAHGATYQQMSPQGPSASSWCRSGVSIDGRCGRSPRAAYLSTSASRSAWDSNVASL